ncbi:RNA chaperone Hfq [Orenia marismortui]|uniref:RNA-binding protein Hfq n=1 Tax=Orenia marismortui TaxID=46469 RepID=A0A4R8H6S5_9FIRM|nr:RNA chaperone Hfq [Orenia marismortui]TDX53286.1 RNA-binding protein Hfq [Orenia marismortui]
MKKQINLQDTFLNEVRKNKVKVTVFLVNGFRITGIVEGFDNFTIIIKSQGKQEMVYKHAISTIVPDEEVKSLFKGE